MRHDSPTNRSRASRAALRQNRKQRADDRHHDDERAQMPLSIYYQLALVPKRPASLGVTETLARLRSTLSQLEETIAQLSSEDCYIAPIGVEAHRYLVKRPYGVYQYNKLTSREAIFPPQEREELGKSNSPIVRLRQSKF